VSAKSKIYLISSTPAAVTAFATRDLMNNSKDTEALIRELEDRRFQAIVDSNFEAFAEHAHPDLTYAHSNGVVDTTASYLKKCRDGYYVYHSVDHPITSIRIEGNVALVFGEMNAEITAGGTRKSLRNKSLAVWLNESGSWKLLAYQPTPIA
jgi:ketosteroid isomerase-like protein